MNDILKETAQKRDEFLEKHPQRMNTKKIKEDDYVLVSGEADEVFRVIKVVDNSVILSNGVAESKIKCTLIPKKFHNKLYIISTTYIDSDSIRQIRKEDRE